MVDHKAITDVEWALMNQFNIRDAIIKKVWIDDEQNVCVELIAGKAEKNGD